MKCPYCGALETRVVDTRPVDGGLAIRRRRECVQCGRHFTTYERPQLEPLMVKKRSGKREARPVDAGKARGKRAGIDPADEAEEVLGVGGGARDHLRGDPGAGRRRGVN